MRQNQIPDGYRLNVPSTASSQQKTVQNNMGGGGHMPPRGQFVGGVTESNNFNSQISQKSISVKSNLGGSGVQVAQFQNQSASDAGKRKVAPAPPQLKQSKSNSVFGKQSNSISKIKTNMSFPKDDQAWIQGKHEFGGGMQKLYPGQQNQATFGATNDQQLAIANAQRQNQQQQEFAGTLIMHQQQNPGANNLAFKSHGGNMGRPSQQAIFQQNAMESGQSDLMLRQQNFSGTSDLVERQSQLQQQINQQIRNQQQQQQQQLSGQKQRPVGGPGGYPFKQQYKTNMNIPVHLVSPSQEMLANDKMQYNVGHFQTDNQNRQSVEQNSQKMSAEPNITGFGGQYINNAQYQQFLKQSPYQQQQNNNSSQAANRMTQQLQYQQHQLHSANQSRQSMQFSEFGSNLQVNQSTAGYPVSQSLNFVKGSVFMTNQAPGNVLNTDGNKSMAGLSQGDILSHQGKEEMREQQTYKRQLHSNMTSRVLQMQQSKGQISTSTSKTTPANSRGLQLDTNQIWTNVKPTQNRNQTPNTHQVSGGPFGVMSGNSGNQPVNPKDTRTVFLSDRQHLSEKFSGRPSDNQQPHSPDVNLQRKQLQADGANAPAGGNKQTFAKVPPKRHAYRSGQNKKDNAKSAAGNISSGQVHGGGGQNQENQLLYKIKIINNPVQNANQAHINRKKGSSVFSSQQQKGKRSTLQKSQKSQQMNTNHSQSQNYNVSQKDMDGQDQRLCTEVLDVENESLDPRQQQNMAPQIGWSNNFYGAMNSSLIQPEQQAVVVQKRKRNIQFGGNNCLLDPRIVNTILEYDMTNFRKFLRLSPNWHHLVLEGINERMNKVEVDFVNKYFEHLFFKKSYTNSSIMYFGGRRGIRVDRILVCEILEQREGRSFFSKNPTNYHLNKCLKASFKYKFTNGSQNMGASFNTQQGGVQGGMSIQKTRQMPTEYCADYKMDIVKQDESRILWMHKDEQEQNQQLKQFESPYTTKFLDSQQVQQLINRPYIQPINQICQGDTIEIAINLFNMQGMIDIDSIEWFPPILTNPTKDTVLTYNNDGKQRDVKDRVLKIFCDTNRVCELEDSVVEWYENKYFQRQSELMDLSFFKPLFQVQSYFCAGVDGLISKIHLLAVQEGRLVNEYIGVPLVVKSKRQSKDKKKQQPYDMEGEMLGNGTIVHEVKRVGLLIDRYVDLELRIGDHLVIYISKSQA